MLRRATVTYGGRMGTVTGIRSHATSALLRLRGSDPVAALLAMFLAFVGVAVVMHGHRLVTRDSQMFHLFEWLITYEGGFVRRGLSGEVVYVVSAVTGATPDVVVWGLQIVGYAAFLGGCFLIVLRLRPVPWQLWPLLFAPFMFAVPAVAPYAAMRKDVLWLATMGLVGAAVARRRSSAAVVTGLVAMVPVVLMHEASLVLLPYLLAAGSAASWTPALKRLAAGSVLAVVVAAGIAASSGATPTQAQIMCSRVAAEVAASQQVETCTESGAIAWVASDLERGMTTARDQHRGSTSGLVVWVVLAAVGLGPALLAARASVPRWQWRVLQGAVVSSTLGTVALMAVAADWGRFLTLNACGIGVATLVMLAARPENVRRVRIGVPATVTLVLVTAAYATMWAPSHVHPVDAGVLTSAGVPPLSP